MGVADTITVYHGSPRWFERPDPDYAVSGDGRSACGLGFNCTVDDRYARERGLSGTNSSPGAVVYALDVDREDIINVLGPMSDRWLDAARRQAASMKLDGLSSDLSRLADARSNGTPFTCDDYYSDRSARTFQPSEMKGGMLVDMVRRSFPSQALENEFLVGMGARGVQTGDVIVLVDYASAPPMRVHEIVGTGPAGVPEGVSVTVGAPTARQHRVEADVALEIGDLRSENLSSAWRTVRATGDQDLITAFRKVARILLSDDYIPPNDPYIQRTSGQHSGFGLRDGVGNVVGRALSGEASDARATAGTLITHNRRYMEDEGLFELIADLARQTEIVRTRSLTAANRANDLLLGKGDAIDPQSARLVMTGISASGNVDAFRHARSALDAVALMKPLDGDPAMPRGGSARLAERMAEVVRDVAEGRVDGAAVDRAIMPLVADMGPSARQSRWHADLPLRIVQAVRGLAASVAGRPVPAPVPGSPMRTERRLVTPDILRQAVAGTFGLADNVQFPVAGHAGWTVTQKSGTQMIRHDGLLANFDADGGSPVPAMVSRDRTAVDVSTDGGHQTRTRTTVEAFSLRYSEPSRALVA